MIHKNSAYFIVNLVFVILIGIALGYSYFFYPNAHPLGCMVKEMTGKDCSTCGFSRAFSAFMHFDFEAGKTYNTNAWSCFLFIFFQFLWRCLVSLFTFFFRGTLSLWFIYSEVIITIFFFLVLFGPLII